MPKPPAAPAEFVGKGKLIRPGLTALGAKTKLYEEGFKLLGRGTVAAALAVPGSDRVVKLVCGMAGHYDAVRLFEEHPDVEEFPRIYGIVELANGCFAYETERLSSTCAPCLQGYSDYDDGDGWQEAGEYFSEEAIALVESVAPLANDTGFIDLHEDNIMARGDGELVMVDPLHNSESFCYTEKAWITSGWLSDRWGPEPDYWANARWRARRQPECIQIAA